MSSHKEIKYKEGVGYHYYKGNQRYLVRKKVCQFCDSGFFAQKRSKKEQLFCSRSCVTRYRKPHSGHKHSEETKEKIRKVHLGRKQGPEWVSKKTYRDEEHPNWKADDVSYGSLHSWVNRKLGKPSTCENCGKSGLSGRKIHWANLNHEYERVLEDWVRLCVSCHKNYDLGNIELCV